MTAAIMNISRIETIVSGLNDILGVANEVGMTAR
jgi:hypothetical protein